MSMTPAYPAFDPGFDQPWLDFDRSFDYSVPIGSDIATRFPRHVGEWNCSFFYRMNLYINVGSRLLRTIDGDLLWRPAADIFETDTDIVVHCDLPGVKKEEISIDVANEQLIISGEHKGVEGFETASSRVRERRIGKFRKIVRLPSGTDPEHIKAKYDNGLLEVKVCSFVIVAIRVEWN